MREYLTSHNLYYVKLDNLLLLCWIPTFGGMVGFPILRE